MKIPSKSHIYHNSNIAKRLFIDWRNAAAQMELEYGIWIEVETEEDAQTALSRIYFKVMEHEFDNLKDLKKALELKAFI